MQNHQNFSAGTSSELFKKISEALHSTGGFAPVVAASFDSSGTMRKPERVLGECYLVPYPRENLQKYAGRAACATYESHLRDACERFTAYLGRKAPQRIGVDWPLAQMLINDADDAGSHIDVFWQNFMLEALARGSMLLLVDMPDKRFDANMAQTLQDQSRAIPYLQAIKPEDVADYRMGRRGRFEYISIRAHEYINNRLEPVIRFFDAQDWRVIKGHDPAGQQVLRSGMHPFGQCPVLIYTENSAPYPCIGRFAQIVPLSHRLFNSRSELVEILRSQTFSLLTQQIASEQDRPAAVSGTTTIGTSAMLFHTGATPAFISPDSGPAQTYLAEIAELRAAIARIGMETQAESGTAPESGLSRKMRFEGLNAALSRFARAMQDLEARAWVLFGRALGTTQAVEVTWPSDYNLIDTTAELDMLLVMQQTGFPQEVLQAKRAAIVGAEFDRAEPAVLQALQDAVLNAGQEVAPVVP